MAPSAIEATAPAFDRRSPIPPPQLYPVREAHFEGYLEPQPDGYQKAKSRDGAAIVIDNGTSRLPFL
jgi:actin-related protein 5